MIQIHSERFPPETVRKLTARSASPFKILKKINSNAYLVDLPPDFGISSRFNISDLVFYKVHPFNSDNSLVDLDESNPIFYLRDSHLSPPPTTHAPLQQNKLIA